MQVDADPGCTGLLVLMGKHGEAKGYLCRAAVETTVFILIRRNAPRITLP